MAEIIKIIKLVNRDTYGVALVEVNSKRYGLVEAEVHIGGDVELFFHDKYDKPKAFVKRAQSLDNINKLV